MAEGLGTRNERLAKAIRAKGWTPARFARESGVATKGSSGIDVGFDTDLNRVFAA